MYTVQYEISPTLDRILPAENANVQGKRIDLESIDAYVYSLPERNRWNRMREHTRIRQGPAGQQPDTYGITVDYGAVCCRTVL